MPKKATTSTARTSTIPFDVAEQLRIPEEMAACLDAWLTEAPDDASGIARSVSFSTPRRRAEPSDEREQGAP
jgi:hypothetical protein